ncbi:NAD(P)-binding protein [Gymnopus androsaceus JB14]|uniref:NAD(P)-binding protein n=1 Tax=Gymnopus androsaceus JB14 TaxID=1447944 RepID=A0A6A4HD23_9AGAR|nr:NAD(P)-binding protein [Gymnopus androsaceus JB14]
MPSKQTVLQVGATGYTGLMIAKALATSDQLVVKALVRPTSLSKPETKQLEALGVEIIPGDLVTSTAQDLEKALQGIDIVICTVLPFVDQKPLFLAAKRAGVKRVVPSDFGPQIPRGVFFLQDVKLAIRDFIIENSIPHTFIQVGWWTNFIFPYPHGVKSSPMEHSGKEFIGTGNVKVAHTAYQSLGEFVKRIVVDPRTLNKTVQVYDGEMTLEEGWALGTKVSGENFDDYPKVSAEDLESRIGRNIVYGYAKSLYVRGDNTVENAVKDGALDARELYPDYQPPSIEELAKEFYKNPPTFTYDVLEL